MNRIEELELENRELKSKLNYSLPSLKTDLDDIKNSLAMVKEYVKKGSWFQSPSEKMLEEMTKLNENIKALRGDNFSTKVSSIEQSIKSIEDLIKQV